jgi:hypothetical protein
MAQLISTSIVTLSHSKVAQLEMNSIAATDELALVSIDYPIAICAKYLMDGERRSFHFV